MNTTAGLDTYQTIAVAGGAVVKPQAEVEYNSNNAQLTIGVSGQFTPLSMTW